MNSNDLTSTTDLYSSDGKLNFLCSLDLFPTPLIKKCPNATKKWLRAVPNETTVQDIGINAGYDEIDNSPTKINFIAVSMIDATERTDNNLIFPNLPGSSAIHHSQHSTTKVTSFMNKNEHCEFDFEKDKSIYTFSDHCSMETITSSIPPYISNGTVSQNTLDGVSNERSDIEKPMSQNLLQGKIGILNIDTSSLPFCSPNVDHQSLETVEIHHIPFQEQLKKMKVNKDLQETVLNEIITQEINQTVFAKATIGKTQGYLSELLRTSKLLEDRSDKEYRRTRHNLEKIKQFLKKPKYERKRIYEEFSNKKGTVVHDKHQDKQKRTVISADVKKYLCDYFHSREGNLCNEDFQFLSSHLKLDPQNVKIFHKNWKQRSKIRAR